MSGFTDDLEQRLREYRPTNEWGDPVHHVICDLEQTAWDWLDRMVSATCDEHPSDIAYSADQMVDAFIAGARQALQEGSSHE